MSLFFEKPKKAYLDKKSLFMGLFGPPKKPMKEPISPKKKPKIHQSRYVYSLVLVLAVLRSPLQHNAQVHMCGLIGAGLTPVLVLSLLATHQCTPSTTWTQLFAIDFFHKPKQKLKPLVILSESRQIQNDSSSEFGRSCGGK